MALNIYDKNGILKLTVSPADSSTHQHAIQEDNVLNLSFVIPEYHLLDVNDYAEWDGSHYCIIEQYVPQQKSTVEWSYNCNFYGIESLIKRGLVLKLVDNEMQPVFALTASARQHMALLVDNINRIFGTTDFKAGEVIATENIHIDYNSMYITDGLSELAKQAGTEWWFDGMTVNLIRCEHGAEIKLGYRNGLTKLERTTANNVKFFTRLYPLGSTRNIDFSTYGYSRLQLPGGQKYVEQNVVTYGIIEHSEETSFSHIYPRRVGTVSSVRSEEKTGQDGNLFNIYYFKDKDIPFDPNDYEIGELVKHVQFESGELNGRDFEVNYNSDTKEFEIVTQIKDYSEQIPNDILIPEIGNKYVLWNIKMPDEYYELAEQEYKKAVDAYMADNNLDKSVYKAPTDYIEIAKRGTKLVIGQRVRLESNEFFSGIGSRSSRITRITRKINSPTQMDIEISDVLSVGKVTALENSVQEIKTIIESTREGLPDIVKSFEGTPASDWNLYSALKSVRSFLSKQFDDFAQGMITFLKGLKIGKDFIPGFTGVGAFFDQFGNGEVESLFIRRKLIVPEIIFNSIDINLGDKWRAPGGGIIKSIDTETRTVVLDLQEGQIGAVKASDICMGIFHSLESNINATEDMDDSLGNRTYAGFYTAYFTITEVTGDRNQTFKYNLRPVSGRWPHSYHPSEMMHFVVYGSFTDKDRQTSVYETRTYTRMLWKQNTWEISAANIAQQIGDLSNMTVHGMNMEGHSAYLNNIYMTGAIHQIKPDGTTAPIPNYLPNWKPGDKVSFYDEVSHEGGVWLCINEDGTESIPSKDNSDWVMVVAPGKDGSTIANLGDWHTGLNVPYLGMVRMGRGTWMCTNKNGTINPPMWCVLDSSGNRILQTQNSGKAWGYILTGEINSQEYQIIVWDGTDGIPGADGKALYTWLRYADDEYGNGMSNNPEGKSFLGLATNKETPVESNDPKDYTWSDIKGADGVGIKGDDGKTLYTWIAYSDNADGSDMYQVPKSTTKYIGLSPNQETSVESSNPADYVWSKFRGEDGKDGDNVSLLGDWHTGLNVPYLGMVRMGGGTWICKNKNGTTNPPLWCVLKEDGSRVLHTQDGGKTWGYILTGEINTDEYELSAENGEDGVGVESITAEYYQSSSSTSTIGGSWSTTRPNRREDWYIWTRSIIKYTNGKTTTTDAICTTGDTGKGGDPGIQGCLLIKSEWGLNNEYRNDEALTGGTRYINIALVRDDSLQTGWQAYKCLKTHISSTANGPGNAEYWEKFGLNVNAIFTSLIIAKDAEIEFMQGNQLLVKDTIGNVVGGISGQGYYWMGGPSPNNAMNVDRADGSGHRAGGNIAWNEKGDVDIKGKITATSGKIGGFTLESGSLYWKGYDYFGGDSRSVRIGVPTNNDSGMVDINFNAATSGKFGVKVIGSNSGGACIYASTKSSGQNYPISANTYAGYFDGGVHVNGNVYCGVMLANEFGTSWELDSKGTYTYRKGVSGTLNLSGLRYVFANGLLVGLP